MRVWYYHSWALGSWIKCKDEEHAKCMRRAGREIKSQLELVGPKVYIHEGAD